LLLNFFLSFLPDLWLASAAESRASKYRIPEVTKPDFIHSDISSIHHVNLTGQKCKSWPRFLTLLAFQPPVKNGVEYLKPEISLCCR